MIQVLSVLKIKEEKIKCSICGKHFTTRIFSDKTYQGGNCFRSLDPKDNSEDWECDQCWNVE